MAASLKNNLSLLAAYIRAHKVMSLVGFYVFTASGLKLAGIADVCPPCLITLATGYHCPGCGLTRALLALLTGDFRLAWENNPLIFIVAPALTIGIIKDFTGFVRRYRLGTASTAIAEER